MWNPFTRKTGGTDARPSGAITSLQERRYDLGEELKARIYLYEPTGFIITSVSGIADAGDVSVLPHDCLDETLADAIWSHLLKFEVQAPNQRERKPGERETYKASGERSIRKFEENSFFMQLETRNQAVLLNARPYNSLKPTLSMAAMANHDRMAIARAIRDCFAGAKVLRAQGTL